MVKRSVKIRLLDMIEAIDGATEILDGRDYGDYQKSFVTRKAIERCVEIFSEASRHIPDDLTAHNPRVPWRSVRDIGNVLRHEYGRDDDLIIWRIATRSFPDLRPLLQAMLDDMSEAWDPCTSHAQAEPCFNQMRGLSMTQTLRRVAIVGGVRTPFCRSNTFYADQSNLDMMTTVLNGLVDKYNLAGVHIDEVTGGSVVTHSRDWNIAREAVLGTKLSTSTPGVTMIQACGTSLQAAMGIGAKIATGDIECGIAVGADTTSDPPIVVSKKLSSRLKEVPLQKSFGSKLAVFKGFSPSELAPLPPSVAEPRTGLSMGQHCELMAQEFHITRAAQDQLALESHQKAAAAYASGYMDDLLVPCAGVYRDNNLRTDISLEKISTLKPAFDKSERGTLTAANSTPLTDGAACVLLASEAWAKQRGLPVLAYLTHSQTAANNFTGGDGLLMAPTIAVARMIERAGLKLQDFDYYEIHEAFAAQVLATMAAWEDPAYCKKHLGLDQPLGAIDRAKLNVMGSSLAFGHPFAATGARITMNLAKILSQRGGRGLISICTAGGMGVTAILESSNVQAQRSPA